MKITLRRIFLSLVLIVLVFLAAVILFLRSPSASRILIAKTQDVLAKSFNTQLTFSDGRVDIFTGLHFKNLKILWKSGENKADIAIDEITARYEFSILSKSFDLKVLQIEHPAIVFSAISEKIPAEVAATSPADFTSLIKSMREFFENPPVRVKIENFSLHHLDLQFTKGNPVTELKAEAHNLDFNLSFASLKNQLAAKSEFTTGDDLTVMMIAKKNPAIADSPSGETSLKLKFVGKLDAGIHQDKGLWLYEIKPTQFLMDLKDIHVGQENSARVMHVKIPLLHSTSDFKLLAKTAELFALNRNSFDVVDLKALTSIPRMEIENRTGNQVSRITSGSQEFSIRSTLQPDLQMIIAYQMRELTAPAFLLKPVSVKWEADCKTSRDLRSTHLTSQALLENLKLFDVTGDTTFDPDKSNLTFKGDVRLDGDPRLAGLVKAAAILKQTGDVRVASHLDAQVDAAQSVQFKSQSSTSEFKLPGLKKPWTATLSSQSNWNQPQRHLDFTGQFGVNNSDYGQWQIQSKLEMTSTTGQAATSSSLLTTSGRTEIKEIRSAVSQIFPVHFSEPMIVTHKISVVNGKPSGDVEAVLPSIEIAKLGKALNTKVSLLVRSPDLAAAKNIDFAMEFQQGQILLEQKLAGQVAALNGLKMTMKAQVRDGSKLTLEEFHADINQSAINMTADATGNTLSKDFQAHAQLNLQIPGDFPEVAGQTIRGQIQVPVSLSIVRGDDVNLSGSVNMRNFSWSKGDLSATGISGRVPFSEKLRREGKVIKFSQLITQNPFERVDFERVRPLIQGADQMTIEKIKWQEKTYGPFVGFFDVHQNMLFAHQFDMDLGAGRVYGEMFFDAYPANLQFGLLSRLTSLNLSEILPKQYLKRMPSGDKNISGRSGFVLDLNKTTMDGRIDITEIGGPQLTALINILDPKYEDEKLNKLRSLLGVGYPTSVALAFAEGYMDMDVGITALGISQRQSLRGIPISTLITQSTSDLVKETQKGPLK